MNHKFLTSCNEFSGRVHLHEQAGNYHLVRVAKIKVSKKYFTDILIIS